MSILGRPQGIFDLRNSDVAVGSLIHKHEVKEILSLPESSLETIPFKQRHGLEVIDERELQKLWYSGKIAGAPDSRIRRAQTSLDEMILVQLMRITYPNAIVEHQVQWGRKNIDLRATVNGTTKLIEFHGPSHFAPSQYKKNPEDPLIRKNQIEQDFGVECVLWPYWIQRCASNIRAIFEYNIQGFGVLWSTNVHFGTFSFSNSAQIIENLSAKFRASRNNGYGYFYGPNTENRNNPEHPIIEQIRNQKKDKSILVPKGCDDINRWLPSCLQR